VQSILIVDDDAQLRRSFSRILTEEGYEVLLSGTGEGALEIVKTTTPDLVIMDIRMPGITGLDVLKEIRQLDAKLPVIIMTAFGTMNTAIEAIKLGAFEYVPKPFEIPDILRLIAQALEAGRLMRDRIEIDVLPEVGASNALIGKSDVMQEVYKAIGRAAPTDATVLIRGESGTGKELVARALYQHSLRADRPFLVINCVAIPETLLESELFGYEKGAFTGADRRKIGRLEQANGGTILLDEIGDMPLSIQAKVLRLLQEKSIERLGGSEPISLDVRILAATNCDLEAAIENGQFREDLYYRLKVVTVELPPLRDRKSDIPLLVDYFLARHSAELKIDNPGITPEALAALNTYDWPGSVRELSNAIHKLLIFSRDYPIQAEDVSTIISSASETTASGAESIEKAFGKWMRNALASGSNPNLLASVLDDVSRIAIVEALRLARNNRSRAAAMLGVSRPTLLAKIQRFGIGEVTDEGPDSQ